MTMLSATSGPGEGGGAGVVVDRRLLTELLIDACVGEQVRFRSPAEPLAGWVREPPRWGDDVRRLVQEALPSLHADEGRLLAWALAEPETRLRRVLVTADHGHSPFVAALVLRLDYNQIQPAAHHQPWAGAMTAPFVKMRGFP